MKFPIQIFAALVGLALSAGAYADPSGRVARLSYARGDVSYSPAGERDWYRGIVNRPLVPGDQLWTGPNARAELQLGNAAVRIDQATSLQIMNLDDDVAQFELNQGTLAITVLRLYPGQVYEVATPTLAFAITQAGSYRVDVDADDNYTTVSVWDGAGQAYGQRASFPLRRGDAVRFYEPSLRDYQIYGLPRLDGFDRFALERDQRMQRSGSLRYVSEDLVGYSDLDEYGTWTDTRGYGPTWFPTRVSADWAPFRDGHWAWQEPYGWTWVDNAPWGYAPSHYGRWVNVNNRWGWLPGPRRERAVYSPALVAFIGGSNFGVSVSTGSRGRGGGGPIGWFPLGPREAYVPSYTVSRQYFDRVNRNNTVIDSAGLASVFQNDYSGGRGARQSRYANRDISGAVTAVPAEVFQNSRSVRESTIRVAPDMTANAQVMRMAEIAPSARAVFGGAATANARPDREVLEREVYSRRAPVNDLRPFAARQQELQRTPGLASATGARQAAADAGVQLLGEQRGAVDVRAQAPSMGSAPVVPLDRSVEPDADRGRGRGQGPGRGQQAPVNGGQPQPINQKPQSIQEIARQRQAEHDGRGQPMQQPGADPRQRAVEQAAQDAQARQQGENQRRVEAEAQRAQEERAREDGNRQRNEQAAVLEQQRAQQAKEQEMARRAGADAQAEAERQRQAAEASAQVAERERQAQAVRQQADVAQQQAAVAAKQAEIERLQAEQQQNAERQRQQVEQQQAEQQRVQAEQAQAAEQQRAQAEAQAAAQQRQVQEQQAMAQREQAAQAQQLEAQLEQERQARERQAEEAAAKQKEDEAAAQPQ